MTDHPIIFSAAMVGALLDGRKTMTRRLAWRPKNHRSHTAVVPSPWQSVKPGDRLWVREKIHVRPIASAMHAYSYFDEEDASILGGWKKVRLLPYDHKIQRPERPVWRPSIHMPREFSRLTLVVAATKIERLQDISEDDAFAEGVQPAIAGTCGDGDVLHTYRTGFVCIWRELHGPDAWRDDPEVVALTFTVHKQNIDAMPKAEAA